MRRFANSGANPAGERRAILDDLRQAVAHARSSLVVYRVSNSYNRGDFLFQTCGVVGSTVAIAS